MKSADQTWFGPCGTSWGCFTRCGRRRRLARRFWLSPVHSVIAICQNASMLSSDETTGSHSPNPPLRKHCSCELSRATDDHLLSFFRSMSHTPNLTLKQMFSRIAGHISSAVHRLASFISVWDKYPSCVPFIFSLGCMVIYSSLNAHVGFRGDAYEIWNVSKHIYQAGRDASFVEYRGPFTFVLYNLLFSLSRILSIDEVVFFRFYSSLLFAFLTAFVFPYLLSYILNRKTCPGETLVFSMTVFYLYRGYFLHPQTDVLAFAFLLVSIDVLISCLNSPQYSYLHLSGAGMLLACSIMMRSTYVFSVPLLAAFFVLTLLARQYKVSQVWRSAFCYLFPCVLLVSVNLICTNNSSVYKLGYTSHNSYVLRQVLKCGLFIQKIEWNAGDNNYPGPMILPERRGIEILRREGYEPVASPEGISVGQYLDLWRKYPVDMFFIVAQRLFCGMDITFNSVFVMNFSTPRIFFSLVNYFLVFLTIVIVSSRFAVPSYRNRYASILLLAMSIPGLVVSLFIVEVRYYISITMTCIAMGVFSFQEGMRIIRGHRLYVFCILFVVLCFLNSISIFNSAERIFPLRIW